MDQAILKTLDWPTILTGQTLLFGMLGKILYSNPETDWLQPLVDEGVFTEAPFASDQPDVIEGLARLTRWSDSWCGESKAENLLELKTDHVRLLSGVGKTPVVPWESVYFNDNRLLFQEQTLDVRLWYRRFGLQAVKLYQEPDDHIGLELSFLAHLASLALQALEQQDEAELMRILEAQKGFLSRHLLVWGPLWCSLMLEHARTDFYQGITLLVKGALKEMASLHDLVFREVDP